MRSATTFSDPIEIPRRDLDRAGVRLSVCDFGGPGTPVLLLHGLAGHAGEWAQTARWLCRDHHVIAFDARGHGLSTPTPDDVSPAALRDDAAFVLEHTVDRPAVVVGHSLGGLTALALAAGRPESVAALVMVDAAPGDGGRGREAAAWMRTALGSWPVPFADETAAIAFFADRFGEGAAGPWAAGLQRRVDGLWPRFDVEVMARTLDRVLEPSTWPDWARVACPTLVLHAEHGVLDPSAVPRMRDVRPQATIVRVPGARHDLHLDTPDLWRTELRRFLRTLDTPR